MRSEAAPQRKLKVSRLAQHHRMTKACGPNLAAKAAACCRILKSLVNSRATEFQCLDGNERARMQTTAVVLAAKATSHSAIRFRGIKFVESLYTVYKSNTLTDLVFSF